MFFDLELLCRQGKGRFIAPWLAATRGISKVPKKEIDVVNIDELCDELQTLIVSESNKPRKRTSLSLSAKLVHGLALIHNKQASMLLDDTVNFLHSMEQSILEKPMQRKPKVPVADVKDKPKKSKIILSAEMVPEDQYVFTVEEISAALAEVPRASVDSITMRDEVLARVSKDEIGFGDLGGIEAELHIQKDVHTISKSPSQFQTIVEQVIEEQCTEDGEPAPKRPLRSLTEPSQLKSVKESVKVSAVTIDEAEGPPTSLVVQSVQAEPSPVIPRRKRKVAPKLDEKFYVHEEMTRKAIRKRREFNPTDEINKVTFPSINADLVDLRDIEASFLKMDVPISGPDFERFSLRLSLMRSIRENRSVTPTIEEQEVTTKHTAISIEIQPSSMDVILEKSQENLAQIMQPAPIASTPILEDREIPPVEVEKTLEPAEERAVLSPPGSTQRRKTAKERQLAIMDIIRKWNFEERDLTIEYLCGSPRTWQKFVAIFENLLILSKNKYVKLICHSGSMELRCIEKGPRLE